MCCSFGPPKERVGKYTGKSQKERDAIFRKGEHKKRATGQADRNNFVEAEKRLLRQVVDPMSSGASCCCIARRPSTVFRRTACCRTAALVRACAQVFLVNDR